MSMDRSELQCQNNVPELIGFDWNVKVVLGSSSLATLQQPLVAVDFYLGECGKSITDLTPNSNINNFSIEMNQTELKHLISVLEKACSS